MAQPFSLLYSPLVLSTGVRADMIYHVLVGREAEDTALKSLGLQGQVKGRERDIILLSALDLVFLHWSEEAEPCFSQFDLLKGQRIPLLSGFVHPVVGRHAGKPSAPMSQGHDCVGRFGLQRPPAPDHPSTALPDRCPASSLSSSDHTAGFSVVPRRTRDEKSVPEVMKSSVTLDTMLDRPHFFMTHP
ncbi:unnamed protein product [Pleuronectes platessa]|uniref:Uncharacterized protein n=1 Tax=Pleuronectes platessa TaxID=8262 RepID=A0A9N7Z5T4_PLEPL|nr:unnamed protein product [Pleuronectes platessa]